MDESTALRAVLDYHREQGDRVTMLRVIPRRCGGNQYLVRVIDQGGKQMSCLDMVMFGKNEDYITELDGVPRDHEREMLRVWSIIARKMNQANNCKGGTR